ncbi:MAG: hypothetical protein PHQ72_01325 [Hespellia sp.]|nr:hypothetical protein [Hespellia sp.]
MKNWKKIFVSVFTICMLLALSGGSVLAAAPYQYQVRVYAGNKGSLGGGSDPYVFSDITSGDSVDLRTASVQVTDTKYYWKGFRVSGRDKREIIPKESAIVKVTSDVDYVVAYGVMSQRVAYTVNYQDANGNTLAPSNTYYGDIGDRPVVAYQYIENYVPQAYAVTRTLSANEADNVFTFTYTPGATNTVVTTTTVNTITGTAAGTTAAGATGAAATTTATPEDAAVADANAGAADAINNAAANDTTVNSPDEETPQALQDQDEETPTSNIDASSGISPATVAIIVGAAALLALVGLGFFLYKKRTGGVE